MPDAIKIAILNKVMLHMICESMKENTMNYPQVAAVVERGKVKK